MKKVWVVLFMLSILVSQLSILFAEDSTSSLNPPNITNQVKPVALKDATPVIIRTIEKMVSGATPAGSEVEYRVVREIASPDGQILIPLGAKAYGKVIQSEKRGMFGKAGKFEFTINKVVAVDGTEVLLRSSVSASGKSNTTAVVVGTIFLSILMVFVNGRDVVIPEATIVSAYIDGDTIINKPLPIPIDRPESIKIEVPKPGMELMKGSVVPIVVNVYPPTSIKSVKIYANDKLLSEQNSQPEIVSWKTSNFRQGEYQLGAEVVFLNGHSIKADPVNIIIAK